MTRTKSVYLALLLSPLAAQAGPINLADIVGGGDGTGTGTILSGIRTGTGGTVSNCVYGDTSGTANTYKQVPTSAFVDGVFIPDGGTGAIQVSTTGLTNSDISNSSGDKTWDYIVNGNPNPTCSTSRPDYYGIDFGQTSQMTFHANNGITFDLNAIEAANTGLDSTSFSALAAVANTISAGVEFSVLVDGVLDQQFFLDGGGFQALTVSLDSTDRFLTLVATDNGNYSFDQSLFGDPILTLSPTSVPEPGTLALLGLGLVGMAARRRKKV